MKIARVETFLIAQRWLFGRIETDDGMVGWGWRRGRGWGEPVVDGCAEVVRAADRAGHALRNPLWRHPDGWLAEWRQAQW